MKSEDVHFTPRSEKCTHCGHVKRCVCTRYPGFIVKRWDGLRKNYSFTADQLLCAAMYESLKPETPLDRFVATLRYFVETEPRRLT